MELPTWMNRYTFQITGRSKNKFFKKTMILQMWVIQNNKE